jgi:hypothetical protein
MLVFSTLSEYHDRMGIKFQTIPRIAFITAVGIALTLAITAAPSSPQFPLPDPSGVWESQQGTLSLMLAGDDLAFSYTAVFGATAHICEGAGIAKRTAAGRFLYKDSQGSVVFLVGADDVRLQAGDGIASFCGANWPGDAFTNAKFLAPSPCRVTAARAYFHSLGPMPPPQNRAYVVSGDTVDTVPVQQTESGDWVLARFNGPKNATAGFLRRSDLDCNTP